MRRSYHFTQFPAPQLVAAKRGRRVSVCLPARNEEATIGQTVRSIRRDLMDHAPLVDELIVIDDGSTDSTAELAGANGADVVTADTVLPEYSADRGKGQAMWKAVHVASGDLIGFCDADVREFDSGFVRGVIGPLLTRDDVTFVKGYYDRPLEGLAGQGGRVTELMARPLISVLFPHLSNLTQPLAGECAAPRDIFENLPFAGGYAVDLGLLIDVSERFGDAGLVQCNLGQRVHRNRPLTDLGPQALSVLQVGLRRAGLAPGDVPWTTLLSAPGPDPALVTLTELPPLAEVPAHRKTA